MKSLKGAPKNVKYIAINALNKQKFIKSLIKLYENS